MMILDCDLQVNADADGWLCLIVFYTITAKDGREPLMEGTSGWVTRSQRERKEHKERMLYRKVCLCVCVQLPASVWVTIWEWNRITSRKLSSSFLFSNLFCFLNFCLFSPVLFFDSNLIISLCISHCFNHRGRKAKRAAAMLTQAQHYYHFGSIIIFFCGKYTYLCLI